MTRCLTEAIDRERVGVLALWVIVAAAVLVGVAFVATQEFSGLDEPGHDEPDIGLPSDRLLRSDDIPRLRFRVVSGLQGGLRGYRFSDVDAAMAKVEEALRAAETASSSSSSSSSSTARAAGAAPRKPAEPTDTAWSEMAKPRARKRPSPPPPS